MGSEGDPACPLRRRSCLDPWALRWWMSPREMRTQGLTTPCVPGGTFWADARPPVTRPTGRGASQGRPGGSVLRPSCRIRSGCIKGPLGIRGAQTRRAP